VFKIKQLIKKELNVKLKLAFLAALLAASAAQAARADALFDTNSTFQVVGGNSPDSFSNTVALTPGTTLLGSGALSLTLTIVPASGGAEWLVFNYSTTAGGAISQPNQNWSLSQNGLVALQPLNFIASYVQFNNNGTAIAPSYSVFGQTLMNNPVPGFTGFGQGANGFKSPDGPGPFFNLGAFADPFSQIAPSLGNTQLVINGWEQALEFAPQVAAVPEPSTWAMMILGFAGVGFIAYRRKVLASTLLVA
jgi:PEP-CTERM motif